MRTVFFDIDTQIDFLYPAGALYVPGAERLLAALTRLNRSDHIVVSTTDAHAENDSEFQNWPPHCIAGAIGQQKPAALLLDRRVTIPTTPGEYTVEGAPQIIIEKQALDCFTNPNLPRVIELLNADRYVVYGVVTEYCVRSAALGLLRTGKPVLLVTDAIQSLKDEDARRTFEEFQQGGGRLTTTDQVLDPK